MNIPANINDKSIEREIWRRLVVKVINWKSTEISLTLEKITYKEWHVYYQGMIKINVSHTRQRVMENLEETKRIIKSNGGFA